MNINFQSGQGKAESWTTKRDREGEQENMDPSCSLRFHLCMNNGLKSRLALVHCAHDSVHFKQNHIRLHYCLQDVKQQ